MTPNDIYFLVSMADDSLLISSMDRMETRFSSFFHFLFLGTIIIHSRNQDKNLVLLGINNKHVAAFLGVPSFRVNIGCETFPLCIML